MPTGYEETGNLHVQFEALRISSHPVLARGRARSRCVGRSIGRKCAILASAEAIHQLDLVTTIHGGGIVVSKHHRKTSMKFAIVIILTATAAAAAEVPTPQVQIAGAILAVPTELRDGAAVLGYDAQGARTLLREGKNEMFCLASDPAKPTFNVACYHKDLEPFMARGRELTAQKITGAKRGDIRFKEIEDGKLVMPREPRTLYVLTGTSFDASTGQLQDSYLRWVIYVPFATPQSTGLSTKASDSAPWLMAPGTAGAHIMISPPKKK